MNSKQLWKQLLMKWLEKPVLTAQLHGPVTPNKIFFSQDWYVISCEILHVELGILVLLQISFRISSWSYSNTATLSHLNGCTGACSWSRGASQSGAYSSVQTVCNQSPIDNQGRSWAGMRAGYICVATAWWLAATGKEWEFITRWTQASSRQNEGGDEQWNWRSGAGTKNGLRDSSEHSSEQLHESAEFNRRSGL